MADYKFPTEVVDLPSKGHFYVEGHPLSKGKVEIKYMTAREEDILTSQNLIQRGTVIDVLLQSLIVDKKIKIDDMLIGDKNAIMVAARILGYGKEYQFTYDGEEQTTDLSKLDSKKMDFSKLARGMNEFSFELVKYNGDELIIVVNCSSDGWISFIDTWDSNWKVFIDEKEKNLEKLFNAYKSVKIKSGKSEIRFTYKPFNFYFK